MVFAAWKICNVRHTLLQEYVVQNDLKKSNDTTSGQISFKLMNGKCGLMAQCASCFASKLKLKSHYQQLSWWCGFTNKIGGIKSDESSRLLSLSHEKNNIEYWIAFWICCIVQIYLHVRTPCARKPFISARLLKLMFCTSVYWQQMMDARILFRNYTLVVLDVYGKCSL